MGDVIEFRFPKRMIADVGLRLDETHSILSIPFEIRGQGIKDLTYYGEGSGWKRYEVTTRALKKLVSEYPLIRQACESFECPFRHYELIKDEILDGADLLSESRRGVRSCTGTDIK